MAYTQPTWVLLPEQILLGLVNGPVPRARSQRSRADA